MKLSILLALSTISSVVAFVQQTPVASQTVSHSMMMLSRNNNNDSSDSAVAAGGSGMQKKMGQAALAMTLCWGVLTTTTLSVPAPANAIDYRLPPIDRSDPNRCKLQSSSIGQSNAQRDKLFDLRECKLQGADASGFDLSGVIMTNTDVSNAKFAESYFSKGYLRESNFEGADFTNAIVDRATFKGSSLKNAIFRNAVLTGTTFEDADVEGADFTEAAIGQFDMRNLCKNPTLKGENPKTGEDTRFSAGCP